MPRTPPPRLTRAQSKERTYDALLDAAHNTFLERGYQGATIDAIAAEAGFTKGAVYAHFDSKEELLCVLFTRTLRQNAERLNEIIDEATNSADILMQGIGQWIESDRMNRVAALGAELEIESRNNPKLRTDVQDAIDEHETGISRILDRYFSIVEREPPLPFEELASAMIITAEGFALAQAARHDERISAAPLFRLILGIAPPGAS